MTRLSWRPFRTPWTRGLWTKWPGRLRRGCMPSGPWRPSRLRRRRIRRFATRLLKSEQPALRRNAVLATAPRTELLESTGVLTDPDAQVRLAALLALADRPASPTGAKLALATLADESVLDDKWLADAATSAAAVQGEPLVDLLSQAQAGDLSPAALQRLEIVGEHLGRSGSSTAVVSLLKALDKNPSGATDALVRGVAKGWPKDKKVALSADDEQRLSAIFEASSADRRAALMRLATRIGSQRLSDYARKLTDGILATIQDRARPDSERLAAARDLVELRKQDAEVAQLLLDLVGPAQSPDLARGLIEAISQSDAAESFDALAKSLGKMTPGQRTAAVRVLLAKSEGPGPISTPSNGGKPPSRTGARPEADAAGPSAACDGPPGRTAPLQNGGTAERRSPESD